MVQEKEQKKQSIKSEKEREEIKKTEKVEVKYRYQFNSWEEYNNYKGLKG